MENLNAAFEKADSQSLPVILKSYAATRFKIF
jgi:hypothetical protein